MKSCAACCHINKHQVHALYKYEHKWHNPSVVQGCADDEQKEAKALLHGKQCAVTRHMV